MNAVLSSLTPQRRAVIGAILVLAVGCAIALPKLNARASTALNSVSVNDASAKEGSLATPGIVTFTVSVSGLRLDQVTVNFATVDGTAHAGTDYVAKVGILTFPTSSSSQQVAITLKGDDLPEPSTAFTLQLSNPTNAAPGDMTGTGTIQNDDLQFSVGDASVNEGDSGGPTAHVLVTMSGASDVTTTVAYATNPGTATAPADYASKSGTLTFTPGQTSKTVDIAVVNDTLDENDLETFTVVLTNPTPPGMTIDDGTGVVTIIDNDTATTLPTLSIASKTFVEGNSTATTSDGIFIVTLTPASAQTVTVHAETSDGTATAGSDYDTTQGTIQFAPGQTQGEFHVPLRGDTTYEGDETFFVTLSNPTGATIASASNPATGTLTDADDKPTIAISSPMVTEGATAVFTVTLSAASARVTTVHVGTVDGTAIAGSDYTAVADAELSFPAGTTSKTTNVQTAADTVDEANETFGLRVISAENATPGPNGTATITDDDATPGLSIADATAAEGNTGTTPLVFTVTLSAASGQTVTVHYGTTDNTATTGDADYSAASGDLSFAPGELTKQVTVNATGDTKAENDEAFRVLLSAPVGATITRSTATGTITNDDGTPPPPPMFITTGAGAGAGSHVRIFDKDGAAQPPDGFAPYPAGPGVRVARGDLDNDGHDELVVAPGPGRPPIIRVFTSNGGFIADALAYDASFVGGVFIAVGDVDGDGKGEVITAPGAGGGPHVRTFALTGAVGSRSLTAADGFMAADPGYGGGLTVASGDVDNDPTDEIIVGHGPNGQPIVAVWNYNPSTQAKVQRSVFLAYGASFAGGLTVAAGDLDGDGRAEIVTGAGPGGGPHVRVFSGAGAGLPGSAYAYGADFSGGVLVAIGDVDGDGDNEIITGAGAGGGPHVRTFDVLMNPGSTSFYAYGPDFTGGVFVAAGRV